MTQSGRQSIALSHASASTSGHLLITAQVEHAANLTTAGRRPPSSVGVCNWRRCL